MASGLAALLLLPLAADTRAQPAQDLAALARQWAEDTNFSGSFRLEHADQLLAAVSRGTTDGAPIQEDTSFWIGSISKQFAAVATLRLVEQRRIDLRAPLASYFPELGADALAKDGVRCSVEHVLSHTCGLPRDLGADPLYAARMLSDPTRAQRLFSQINSTTLDFAPGTQFLYSNAGYALIGLLVQRAAGVPYERYLQQTFWTPLGMTRTGIEPRTGITLARGRVSFGFGSVDAASLLLFDPDTPAEMGAAGNIYSTPADLLRWSYALHHGSLLGAEAYQSFIQPRREDYGLGIASKEKAFGKTLFHTGSLLPHSTTSFMVYVPGRDLALAGVSNRALSVSSLTNLADWLLSQAAHTPTSTVPRPPDLVQILVGLLPLVRLLFICGLLFWLWSCWRRRAQLGRVKWWLSFHAFSLFIAVFACTWRDFSFDPLLFGWCIVALALATAHSWWTLPLWPQTPRKLPRYYRLFAAVSVASFAVLFAPQRILVPFVAICVLPGWGIAWLRTRQNRSRPPVEEAVRG